MRENKKKIERTFEFLLKIFIFYFYFYYYKLGWTLPSNPGWAKMTPT